MFPDDSDLSALLDRYERPLVRYAQSILGDLEAARDVAQETFIKLVTGPGPSGKSDGAKPHPANPDSRPLSAWLFTVCRNLAFDVRKKENRMSALTEPETITAGYDGTGTLERQETMAQVLRLMDSLPTNQREVLRLKFQCDLSYREISEITHLSVTNVGFLIHTAIKSLRKELLAEAKKGGSNEFQS